MNRDWSEGDRQEDRSEEIETFAPAAQRMTDLRDRPLRTVPERTRQILGLAARYNVRVPLRPRGRRRYLVEWEWESRPLNCAEIGWLVGCSRQSVRRTIDRALKKVSPVGGKRRGA